MDHHRGLAGRGGHAGDIALAREGPRDLNAKIHRHDVGAFVVIEKDAVAVGPQTGMLAEESSLSSAGLNAVEISPTTTRRRTAARMRAKAFRLSLHTSRHPLGWVLSLVT